MTRNVVISGGGTGIGLAAAQVFAAEGDQVLLLGRRAEVLDEGRGARGADVRGRSRVIRRAVRGVVGHVEREFGTVDVLIHCCRRHGAAGAARRTAPIRSTRVAHDWTVNFRLNMLTAALLTEGLRDRLARRADGCCSSAPSPPTGGPAAGRTRGPRPRCTRTPMTSPGSSGRGDHRERRRARVHRGHRVLRGRDRPRAARAARRRDTPTGRAGTPGDVAATLHWLASPAAGHVTSQVVQVNGGAERGH